MDVHGDGRGPRAARPQLALDHFSPVPLYHQLTSQLASAITDGVLRPGDWIEGEVALSRRLDVSRPTIRRSLAQLEAQGLLVRRRGARTMVAGEGAPRFDDVASLYDELLAARREPRTRVLSLAAEQADQRAAHALQLETDATVVALHRLRLAGGAPLAVMWNWLPQLDASADALEVHGLYELLRARGIRPAYVERSVGSRQSSREEQQLLQLAPGEPVLAVMQTAFDARGRPIEFGEHAYRADRYRVEFSFRPSLPAA